MHCLLFEECATGTLDFSACCATSRENLFSVFCLCCVTMELFGSDLVRVDVEGHGVEPARRVDMQKPALIHAEVAPMNKSVLPATATELKDSKFTTRSRARWWPPSSAPSLGIGGPTWWTKPTMFRSTPATRSRGLGATIAPPPCCDARAHPRSSEGVASPKPTSRTSLQRHVLLLRVSRLPKSRAFQRSLNVISALLDDDEDRRGVPG